MMDGTIWLHSSVEKPSGTCFQFTIPYRPYTPSDVEICKVSLSPPPVKKNLRNADQNAKLVVQGKVLVAEDEPVSRRMVHRMLNIAGYDVILAEDGEQAVGKFQSHDDIVLILMDVQMPKMDGLTATSKIREMERNSATSGTKEKKVVPIIALSAGAMKGGNERGLEAGMTDYVTKPVNFKLLKEKLGMFLAC